MFRGTVPSLGIAITLFLTILITFLTTLYLLRHFAVQQPPEVLNLNMGPQYAQASVKLVLPPSKMNQTEVMPNG